MTPSADGSRCTCHRWAGARTAVTRCAACGLVALSGALLHAALCPVPPTPSPRVAMETEPMRFDCTWPEGCGSLAFGGVTQAVTLEAYIHDDPDIIALMSSSWPEEGTP